MNTKGRHPCGRDHNRIRQLAFRAVTGMAPSMGWYAQSQRCRASALLWVALLLRGSSWRTIMTCGPTRSRSCVSWATKCWRLTMAPRPCACWNGRRGGLICCSPVWLPSGLTGPQLVEAARALRPRLKVLFTTGYARNALVHHGRLEVGVDLITKPFSYADLAAKVRDGLDDA